MDVPPGSAEFEVSNELERLRRRAYGPDADIAGDAAAQARLFELESARRQRLTSGIHADGRTPAPLPELVRASERAPGPERLPVAEPAGGSATANDGANRPTADAGPRAGASTAPWWRRRWLAILVVAIAAIAVGVALVGWISQLLAFGAAPILTDTPTKAQPLDAGGAYDVVPPDYVLALESVGAVSDVPKDPHGTLDRLGLGAGDMRRYENFGYLSVWSGESRYGTVCLLVAHPVQGLDEGIGAEACSPDSVDTIADLLMPSGRLTRFVLKGDRVDVYIYVKSANPIAPPG
ncbi:hypothetical protein [Mycetocola sp. 2940]|uniref:hypothetical protein n=1 Tax=Mycetocola sp. 2940 TaxID=3156452 RepID=UPI0033995AA3